jgi:hypothetical protein
VIILACSPASSSCVLPACAKPGTVARHITAKTLGKLALRQLTIGPQVFYHAASQPKPNNARQDPPSVHLASLNLPTLPAFPPSMIEIPPYSVPLSTGPDDGGIHRGDREDTGDNEARPDEMGSGFAQPTVDPTSFGGTTSIRHPTSDRFDIESELGDDDGFEVMEPTDGRLGLTNVGDTPADDWAADTGPTRTPESEP